jgi:hypothetical protein
MTHVATNGKGGSLMRPAAKRSKRNGIVHAACGELCGALERRILMTLFTPVDGAALTTALNIAQLGDTITLQAGTTYTGRFVLKNKTTGSGWITIQSSNLASLPADGVRVTPADAPNMAHIQAPGFNDPAIATQASAHHFKFVGIEFVGPANNSSVTAIVALGDDTTAQSTYASVPQSHRHRTARTCVRTCRTTPSAAPSR